MPAVAATNPPVLIAMVAAATERIRVGSGGVMLPNHAPLVVAEQFALLEAAHPGRIDLGIGRAPGTDPVTSYALRHGAGGVTTTRSSSSRRTSTTSLTMMSPGGAGAPGQRPDAPAARDARTPTSGADGLAARLVGLLRPARRGEGPALRLRPPLLRHAAPPRRSTLYRSAYRPSRGPPRAADLPHRQRRRRGDPGGGRPARPAQPAVDGGPAHRAAARRRSRSSRRPRRAALPEQHRALADQMLARWVVGTPDEAADAGRRARRDVRRRRGDGAPGRRRPLRYAGRPGARLARRRSGSSPTPSADRSWPARAGKGPVQHTTRGQGVADADETVSPESRWAR